MAPYVKYNKFIEDMWNKVHDLFGTTDTLKVALCSDAPAPTTDATLSDRTQVANGNGYTTGGEDIANDSTRTGGTVTLTGTDVVWTATGAVGPFRYVDLYNDTPTSPADPLISYWDYGSNVSLASGETFTVDFGASIHTAS